MPHITHQEYRINYEVMGHGPPLVLHHGFSDSLACWADYGYVDALASRYRLILLDSRGHGDSDKPYVSSAYTQRARAADVVAVLDALSIGRAFYLGYSLGGWIGFGAATFFPERFHAFILGGIQPYGQSFAEFRRVLQKGTTAWADLLAEMAPELRPHQLRRFRDNDAKALLASLVDRPDISAVLPTIRRPCLLYAGTADPLYPAALRCAARLPHGAFFSLPGLNHIQANLQGETIARRAADFLAMVQLQVAAPV